VRVLRQALPHLTVVGWSTITEDRAAAAFSRGFYDALARGLVGGGGGRVSIAEAFANGEAVFLRAGFATGDPAGPQGRSVHGTYGMVTAVVVPHKKNSDGKTRVGQRRGSGTLSAPFPSDAAASAVQPQRAPEAQPQPQQ
jgi:hypothetical protein